MIQIQALEEILNRRTFKDPDFHLISGEAPLQPEAPFLFSSFGISVGVFMACHDTYCSSKSRGFMD